MFAVSILSLAASTVLVEDRINKLTPEEHVKVREAAANVPDLQFTVILDNLSELEMQAVAAQAILSDRATAIVLNPNKTQVRVAFGMGSGVPPKARPSVIRAGNALFQARRWGEGIAEIITTIGESRTIVVPASTQQIIQVGTVTISASPLAVASDSWLLPILIVAITVAIAAFIIFLTGLRLKEVTPGPIYVPTDLRVGQAATGTVSSYSIKGSDPEPNLHDGVSSRFDGSEVKEE